MKTTEILKELAQFKGLIQAASDRMVLLDMACDQLAEDNSKQLDEIHELKQLLKKARGEK